MKNVNLRSRPVSFAPCPNTADPMERGTARTPRRAVSRAPTPRGRKWDRLMKPANVRLACMLALFVALPSVVWATPRLDAYALSAAGSSHFGSDFSCATFGPDSRSAKYGASYQVGLPDTGCGVAEDSREVTATTGSVTANSSLKVAFGKSPDLRIYDGSSGARAQFGDLGASAKGTYAGGYDSSLVDGSQAGALQTETMTFHGGSGSGMFVPTFTFDGSLFTVGQTYAQFAFYYAVNSGPQYLGFRIQSSRGELSFYGPGGYVVDFPGLTTSGDAANGFTVSGTTAITLNLPIQFDTPADFTFALWAAVLPGPNGGLFGPSAADVAFLTSAKLTGIDVLGSDGRPLSDFSIDAASGTRYGSNGVIDESGGGIAVPEPSGLGMLLLGFAVCGGLSWRRVRSEPGQSTFA